MPVHNGAQHIVKTLDSIRKQTYSNWEVILVNDCSTDDTIKLVSQFSGKVSNPIKIITNKINRGVSFSRNVAVANASGTWIAMLDSDDIWLPNHLETLINEIEKSSEFSVIYSGCVVFQDDIKNIITKQEVSTVMLRNFKISLFTHRIGINSSTSFIKKESWDNVGGMIQDINFGEEMELFIRLARMGAKFKFTHQHTTLYRKYSNSSAASNNSIKMAFAGIQIFEKHFDWDAIPLKIRANELANAHLSYARLIRQNDIKMSSKHSLKALKIKMSAKNAFYFLVFRFLSLK